MVPEHLVLKKVLDVLEVFLQVCKGMLIIPDLGIGKIIMVQHDSLDWERQVGLDFTELSLIVDEDVRDDMWMILLIKNNDIEKLLP